MQPQGLYEASGKWAVEAPKVANHATVVACTGHPTWELCRPGEERKEAKGQFVQRALQWLNQLPCLAASCMLRLQFWSGGEASYA